MVHKVQCMYSNFFIYTFNFYIVRSLFFISILTIYTCKHKIYKHKSYIYLICLGMKKIIIKIKIKIFKKLKLWIWRNYYIKQPYLIYIMLTSNLFVTKRKSMVAFNIRVLLLLSKELSPYRRVSIICKLFLSKMCLLMFLRVFMKVDLSLE